MTPAAAAAGPVLVLGASGKTGRAVTRALAARGVRVRAAVRPGRPTAAVLTAGADEAVAVDLGTGQGLAEALTRRGGRLPPGAQRAPRRGRHGRAGLRGGRAGSGGAPGVPLRAAPRRRLDAAPRAQGPGRGRRPRHPRCPWTVLRPAAYHQNLLGAALRGRIAVPYALDAPFTNVDLGDVAEVAAQALTGALPRRRHPRARRARDAQRARPGRGRHRRARPPRPRRAGRRSRTGPPGPPRRSRPGPGRPHRDVPGLRRGRSRGPVR